MHAAHPETLFQLIASAAIMKKNMEKKNLLKAKAKCPFCEGYWHAILAGPKKHIHLHCDGTCNTMMMT